MATKPKKHRPKLSLLVPRVAYGGEPFTATAVIKTKAPVDIDWLDATITGTERVRIGAHDSALSRRHTIYRGKVRLRGKSQLAHGETRLPFEVELPAHAPPSYDAKSVEVAYQVKLQVSIPWWPDARASFALAVSVPPLTAPGKPLLVASDSDGPQGREPYMELSLASDVITPGLLATGSVALGNVAKNRYHAIRVAVIGTNDISLLRTVETASEARFEIPVDAPEEGQSFPLRFRIPADTPPSHVAKLYDLSYRLQVTARRRWASDLVIVVPVTVAPGHSARRDEAPSHAPAATGSDRVHAVWQHVADQLSIDFDGEALRSHRDGVDVHIARSVNDAGVTRVVATLTFPSLNLDLSIAPATLFKSGRAGVQVGDYQFDRRHRVTGRNDYQLEAFAKELQSRLAPFGHVTGNDERWQLFTKNNGTVTKRVTSLARDVLALADAIAQARRRVPPPRAFQPHMHGWRALAQELAGELDAIGVAIRGELDGAAVDVHHAFTPTGETARTLITVTPPAGLDRERRFYAQRPPAVCSECKREYTGETSCGECDVALPARPQLHVANMSDLSGDDLRLAERVVHDAERFAVSAENLELTLLPQHDAAPVGTRLRALTRLARALAPGARGPYR